jgi:hypothetical protein
MTKKVPNTKQATLTFVRQEGTVLSTIATISFHPVLKKGQTPLEKLKEVVTLWVAKTKAGKKAWEYSGGDLNIGDLASYESDFANYGVLHGLFQFHILNLFDGEEVVPFDTILANSPE